MRNAWRYGWRTIVVGMTGPALSRPKQGNANPTSLHLRTGTTAYRLALRHAYTSPSLSCFLHLLRGLACMKHSYKWPPRRLRNRTVADGRVRIGVERSLPQARQPRAMKGGSTHGRPCSSSRRKRTYPYWSRVLSSLHWPER